MQQLWKTTRGQRPKAFSNLLMGLGSISLTAAPPGPYLGPLRPSCRLLWNVAEVTTLQLRKDHLLSYQCLRQHDKRVLRQRQRPLCLPPLARANDERSTWYHCFDSSCLLLRRWSACTATSLIRTKLGRADLFTCTTPTSRPRRWTSQTPWRLF
jgi:hypothetical protein